MEAGAQKKSDESSKGVRKRMEIERSSGKAGAVGGSPLAAAL